MPDINAGAVGAFRMEGDAAGYAVYVGEGGPPDFTLPPAEFSATLPFTTPLAPAPAATTVDYHVCVRRRNGYGLESLNQLCEVFTVDDAGVLQAPPVSMPQSIYAEADGTDVRVRAFYPGFTTDPQPADQWHVWVQNTAPAGLPDGSPTYQTTASERLSLSFGPFAADDYYVSVALRRTSDGMTTDVITATITMAAVPDIPAAVSSGFEED